jgi:RNA polymerase sigma factor FliA
MFLSQRTINQAWLAFRDQQCQASRQQIILHYAYLVKATAGRLITSPPAGLDHEDLLSAGIMGLIRAVDSFDCSRDVKFETYAITVVQGALREFMRKHDPLSRTIRDRSKVIEKTRATLEYKLDRQPTEVELAEAAGLTEESVRETMRLVATASVRSLDTELAEDGSGRRVDLIPDLSADMDRSLMDLERKSALGTAVNQLPLRERHVVSLYYVDNLTFREMGEVLGVTESRVHQIHTQALTRLKKSVEKLGHHAPF